MPDNTTYSIVGGMGAPVFAISSNGTLTVKSAVLDFETTPSYDLQIMVLDKGGLNDTQPFTVTIIDVNEAPVLAPFAAAVPEGSPAGTIIGAPLVATDPDVLATDPAWRRMRFTIVGDDAAGLFV